MKVFIFAVFLALASAKQFKVVKDGKTCALLTVDGEVDLAANKGGKIVAQAKLQLAEATVIKNSTCETIKLNVTNVAEVWFQFDAVKDKWQVTPITAFNPETVFGKDVNETDTVSMKAKPLTPFAKTASYKCAASQTFNFAPETVSSFNYTASAAVTDFQIQSLESDTFKKGYDCPADAKPKNYACKDGGKTMILMEGNFTLQISYNKTVKGKIVNATQTIYVPAPNDTTPTGSICTPGADSEILKVNFFDTWACEFGFVKDKDNYHIANLSVTYSYDKHLPDHAPGPAAPITVDLPVGKDYLKASNKGYYICNAKLDKTDHHGLTLTSKDFKYRAFDTDNKGFTGDISECSADESSNSVVPIAVGAALAGLVVIVLIAYLIGRKRSRKQGYESV